jgi:hypothetical protein
MTTLTLTVEIPSGAAPSLHSERGLLVKALHDAANEIGGTAKSEGVVKHDGRAIGSWSCTPAASE